MHLATLLAANCDHVDQSFGGGLVPTLESIVLLLRCAHVGVYHSVPVEKSSSGVVVPTWESGTNSNLCRKLWKNSQRRRTARERTSTVQIYTGHLSTKAAIDRNVDNVEQMFCKS